jgi:hypothetical protein
LTEGQDARLRNLDVELVIAGKQLRLAELRKEIAATQAATVEVLLKLR